ncbi:MAG TPA: hypothetical protein VL983_07075 [Terriglobales bacterium]|nr:hypothetical protein [Terriglobales bacterium]
MTTVALGGKSLAVKLSHGASAVARIAICDSMRSDQRKTVLVRIDILQRNLPTTDFVAEITLRPILASMDVGMAVLAVMADVGEDRMGVAFLASNCYV